MKFLTWVNSNLILERIETLDIIPKKLYFEAPIKLIEKFQNVNVNDDETINATLFAIDTLKSIILLNPYLEITEVNSRIIFRWICVWENWFLWVFVV